MLEMSEDTFGHQYAKWMQGYGYSADERPVAKHVDDIELAYVLQRYKEVHDTLHVLLGYGTSVEEEIAVKWFEMLQTNLPMAALASLVGPTNLLLKNDRRAVKLLSQQYLPHILSH